MNRQDIIKIIEDLGFKCQELSAHRYDFNRAIISLEHGKDRKSKVTLLALKKILGKEFNTMLKDIDSLIKEIDKLPV